MSGTDYLSLGTDAVLLRAISAFGREDIVFSDVVTKINRKDRPQERVLLLTTRALYNLNKARKVKRRIPLERVASVTVSLVSDEFVIHVPSEYDYRIMTARKAEAVECLSAARRALTGVPLPVLDTAATTLKYAALTKSTASRRRPPASPQVQSSGGWASGPSLGDGVGASAALAGISGLTISARADASNGSIDYEDEESDVEAPPPQPRGPLVEARGVLRGSGLFAAFHATTASGSQSPALEAAPTQYGAAGFAADAAVAGRASPALGAAATPRGLRIQPPAPQPGAKAPSTPTGAVADGAPGRAGAATAWYLSSAPLQSAAARSPVASAPMTSSAAPAIAAGRSPVSSFSSSVEHYTRGGGAVDGAIAKAAAAGADERSSGRWGVTATNAAATTPAMATVAPPSSAAPYQYPKPSAAPAAPGNAGAGGTATPRRDGAVDEGSKLAGSGGALAALAQNEALLAAGASSKAALPVDRSRQPPPQAPPAFAASTSTSTHAPSATAVASDAPRGEPLQQRTATNPAPLANNEWAASVRGAGMGAPRSSVATAAAAGAAAAAAPTATPVPAAAAATPAAAAGTSTQRPLLDGPAAPMPPPQRVHHQHKSSPEDRYRVLPDDLYGLRDDYAGLGHAVAYPYVPRGTHASAGASTGAAPPYATSSSLVNSAAARHGLGSHNSTLSFGNAAAARSGGQLSTSPVRSGGGAYSAALNEFYGVASYGGGQRSGLTTSGGGGGFAAAYGDVLADEQDDDGAAGDGVEDDLDDEEELLLPSTDERMASPQPLAPGLESSAGGNTASGHAAPPVQGWARPESIVSLESFELLRVIGRGSYGKVFQVRKRDTGEIYAMKVLSKALVVARNQVEHTQAERAILESIDHPFLIKLAYAFQTPSKLYLILPYLRGGEVFYHLKQKRRLDEDLARFYIAEIALGIGHLHAVGIVYRDLKPENVLLADDGHVKLTDFGLSKVLARPSDTTKTFCGTPEYLAPEVVDGLPHDKSVDWWGLGILLWEFLTGLPPFYSTNVQVMYDLIRTAPLVYPAYMSRSARELITALLERNPLKRLGNRPGDGDVEAIKAHRFFATIDWDALYHKRMDPPWRPAMPPRDSAGGAGALDTSNFDREFTSEPVMIDGSLAANESGALAASAPRFDGFTYQAPNALLGGGGGSGGGGAAMGGVLGGLSPPIEGGLRG